MTKPYRPTKEEVTEWLNNRFEGRYNFVALAESYLLALDIIEASRWAPAQMRGVESRTRLQQALNHWDGVSRETSP